jgi:hypothetical protein
LLIVAVLLGLARLAVAQDFVTNTYSLSTAEFANPERGFYIQADSYASSPSAVPNTLANYRVNGKNSPGNTYNAKIALLLRLFYLDSFVNAPISASFLNSIQSDFNSIRSQGCKAIVRFAYNQDQTRPFNEPSKARILEHIGQLKPLLQTNSDVIAVLQQGFIGAWGEGYFTDIFYTNGQAGTIEWSNRTEVVAALLDALPTSRMLQVRVPQHKQKYLYGPLASASAGVLNPLNAFNGSDAARIGFHNDCFLASPDDYGTYANYDLGVGTSPADFTAYTNYMALDSRYTPVGGETCAINNPTDDCSSAGGTADSQMAMYHYSFLNQSYNAGVNDGWVSQGCIEDIKLRLGYRFQMLSGVFRAEAQPGQTIPLRLEFANVGFAAPYNLRGLEFVLRAVPLGQKYYAELSRDHDVRRWLPGSNYLVETSLTLPTNLPVGSYECLLNLPDPAPTLYGQVPFSIRLANVNAFASGGSNLGAVWEASSGYHRLGTTLLVNNTATNPASAMGSIPVLDYPALVESYATWRARHFPGGTTNGEPEADPDLDGRRNLLEYAVGSNPTAAGDANFFRMSQTPNELTLTIAKGPGTRDVDFEVEGSPDLSGSGWTPAGIQVIEDSPRQLRVMVNTTNAMGFLRLKVALQ